MKCDENVILATLHKRVNRFLALVQLEDDTHLIEAHVPDPGRLIDLLIPHAQIALRPNSNKNRKTKYTVVGVKKNDFWVNIDSQLTNRLFSEEYKKIKSLKDCKIVKKEYTFGNSRIDFLMENEKTEKLLVEVKSVTLVKNDVALFPDAPTKRGQRHINELKDALQDGYQSAVVFIVKRPDCRWFSPNWEIDPAFSKAFTNAVASGVIPIAVKCTYDPFNKKEITIQEEIPVINKEKVV